MPRLATIRNYLFYLIPVLAILVGIAPQEAANPWMLAPFCILSLYLVLSGRLSNIKLNDPVLLGLILLWLGWTWGGIFSEVPFASQVTWLILGVLPISYLCALNRDIRPLLYAICAIAIALATIAIYVMLFTENHYWRARLFFDDENILAALIAFVIPLMVSFYFTATDKKWKILIYLCLGLLGGGLLLTQSRSGFIGCAVGLGAVLIKNKNILSKKSLRFAIPFAVLLIAALFMTSFGDRLLLAIQIDKDVLGRIALYKSALIMAWQNPVHGVGLGVFHLYYPPFKTFNDNSSGFWVHMDSLQWAVETGWATALVFYALAGYVGFRYLKKDLTPLQIGAGASLLTIFAIAHACYVLHYVPILIIAGILLTQFSPTGIETSRLRYIPGICLTLVILSGLWTLTQITPTLYFWTRGVQELSEKNLTGFLDNMKKCIDRGDPKFPGCRMEAAHFMIDMSVDPDPQTLTWLEEASLYDAREVSIPIYRASYYRKKYPDNIELPMAEYRKSLKLDPSSWAARKNLVALLEKQGKNQEAFDTLEIARKYQISGAFLDDFYDIETNLSRKIQK